MLNKLRTFFAPENRMAEDDPIEWASGTPTTPLGEIEGVSVNNNSALMVPVLKRCVDMLSSDVAACNLELVKRNSPPGKDPVQRQHRSHYVAGVRWNRNTSAFQGWKSIVAQYLLTGNGYALISRNMQTQQLNSLHNINPAYVHRNVNEWTGEESYRVTVKGESVEYLPDKILHLQGLNIAGNNPLNPVEALCKELTLAMGIREYSIESASRGFRLPAALHIKSGTPANARDRLETQIKKRAKLRSNWLDTIVLRDSAELNTLGQTNQHGQLLELQEQQTRQVALFFGVSPSKLGLPDSVSYNSSVTSQAQYIQNSLTTHLKTVSSESNMKLLTLRDSRSGGLFFRHDCDALIETDPAALTQMLVAQRNAGLISANEGRSKLGYSPSKDELADRLINPQTTDLSSKEVAV